MLHKREGRRENCGCLVVLLKKLAGFSCTYNKKRGTLVSWKEEITRHDQQRGIQARKGRAV